MVYTLVGGGRRGVASGGCGPRQPAVLVLQAQIGTERQQLAGACRLLHCAARHVPGHAQQGGE